MWRRRRDDDRDSAIRRVQWVLLGGGLALSVAAVCATLRRPQRSGQGDGRSQEVRRDPAQAVPPPEPARSLTVPPRPAESEPPQAGPGRVASAAAARVWTAGVTSVPRSGVPLLLDDVRAARNDGFDRVVFEFRDAIPGYHVRYVDQPVRDCGAGEVRTIAGDGWLEVRFSPAVAHTEAGEPTITERERALALPIQRELELTCDFEAVVTWVLGAASPHRYSLLELRDPPRLVVDIEH